MSLGKICTLKICHLLLVWLVRNVILNVKDPVIPSFVAFLVRAV